MIGDFENVPASLEVQEELADSSIGAEAIAEVLTSPSAPASYLIMGSSTMSTTVATPERGAPKLRIDGSQVGMTGSELSTLVREEAEKMVRQIMEAKEKETYQLQVKMEEEKRLREKALKVKEDSHLQSALAASLEDLEVMSAEQRSVVEMAMLSPTEVAAKKAKLASQEENEFMAFTYKSPSKPIGRQPSGGQATRSAVTPTIPVRPRICRMVLH